MLLKKLTKLENLLLVSNHIESIDALKNMKNLKLLDLRKNLVYNIERDLFIKLSI